MEVDSSSTSRDNGAPVQVSGSAVSVCFPCYGMFLCVANKEDSDQGWFFLAAIVALIVSRILRIFFDI